MKIALVLKTDGLEYDDRVRKEILSVQKLYPEITFKIFVMLPQNKEEEGVTSYGVPYKSIYIPARDKYPSAKKNTLKAWQFYDTVKKDIKSYDAIWVADIETVFIPLVLRHKHILWDLHELPMTLTNNSFERFILRQAFNRCKVIIHANSQREQYLERIGVIDNPLKHFVLRNYPDFDEEDVIEDNLFQSFVKWKGTRKCVYLQGIYESSRAPFESISAVLSIPNLCAVVVGSFNANIKLALEDKYGEDLQSRVMFVGRIPQLKIPQYIKQCYTTLVFYKNVEPNNYYCEANRFYQSIICGIPAVVGNNPSMKEIIDMYECGISIDDDGRNVDKIINGVNKLINNYDYLRQNALNTKSKISWDKQDNWLKTIIENLFQQHKIA